MYTLEDITDVLDRLHQRATYEAVAGLVGMPARSLMAKEIKRPKNSWVVAIGNGLPTNYQPAEKHKNLLERNNVLETSVALREWLRNPK